MIINLSPGDKLVVQFEDADGEFCIHFDSKTYPNAVVVEETAGLPDNSKKREGILYREDFSDPPEETINDLGLTQKHRI